MQKKLSAKLKWNLIKQSCRHSLTDKAHTEQFLIAIEKKLRQKNTRKTFKSAVKT